MCIIIIIHGEAGDANLLVCFVRVHQLWLYLSEHRVPNQHLCFARRDCTPPSVPLASWRHGRCDEVTTWKLWSGWGDCPLLSWRHGRCDEVSKHGA